MSDARPLSHGSAVALGTGCLVLSVYVATLHPGVPGGDAGELIAVAGTGGVAHPPGYPLYSLLAGVFARLPWGSLAWRVNMFSAVCGAAAASLLADTVARATRQPWAGFVAGAGFAFAPLPWTYAVGAEVFSLHVLFVVGLLALALRWSETPTPRLAIAMAGLAGLGLCHHHTLILYVAPLGGWVLWTGRRLWTAGSFGRIALAFGLGLLPYLYLPVAAALRPPIYWGDFSSLAGFVAHLTRADYGSLQLGADDVGVNGMFLAQLAGYAVSLWHNSLGVGVPLMGMGLLYGWRHRRSFTGVSVVCFVLYLVVFHALANLPVDQPLFLEVTSRFWQQPHLVAFVWLGFGAAHGFARWPRHAPFLALAAVALQLGLHYAHQDQSDNDYVGGYGRTILAPLPERALLLTRGDVITNSVRYAQIGEGLRRDVVILDQEMLTKPWYVAGEAARHDDVVFPGTLYHPGVAGGFGMGQFLAANSPRRPLYVYPEFKPGDPTVAAFELWPEGLASRVVPLGAAPDFSDWEAVSEGEWRKLQAIPWPDFDRWGAATWERIVGLDLWEARHRQGLRALTWAMAHGQGQVELQYAVRALSEVASRHPLPPPHVFKNLGLAAQLLSRFDSGQMATMRHAWQIYLDRGPPDDRDRDAIAAALKSMPTADRPAADQVPR